MPRSPSDQNFGLPALHTLYIGNISVVRKSLLLVRNVKNSVEDDEKCKNVMVSTRPNSSTNSNQILHKLCNKNILIECENRNVL